VFINTENSVIYKTRGNGVQKLTLHRFLQSILFKNVKTHALDGSSYSITYCLGVTEETDGQPQPR
jgi:hypothetical protein